MVFYNSLLSQVLINPEENVNLTISWVEINMCYEDASDCTVTKIIYTPPRALIHDMDAGKKYGK